MLKRIRAWMDRNAIASAHKMNSELQEAQGTLRESEERYKLMFDSAELAINITRGREITYANPSYLKMFGFSDLNELKSVAPLDLFSPESRSAIAENIRQRAEGLPVPASYEAECLRKDGTHFPVLMYLNRTVFVDGPATVGSFWISLNASGRKKKWRSRINNWRRSTSLGKH